MRSTGSRFTPGIWGFRVCSLNVAFASAPVRNRSREVAMAVPIANFAKVVISGSFKRRVASFRVAGVALCDNPTCFLTCRKSKAQYLRVIFKRWVAFFVAGAALWWPPWSFCVADAALQTCRVACFLQIAMSRLRQAVPTCKFRGRRGILWGVMQIDGSLTRHRFWGSKFWSSWENPTENADFKATKCEKFRKSRTKRWFWVSNMSRLHALVFLWRRRVYGGSCKASHFRTGSNAVLRGRRGTAWHLDVSAKVSYVVLCDKHNTFGRFSEDESHFSRQAQHFGYLHHRFAWQVQHFRRVLLRVFCESRCQGWVKWWQRANRVAGKGSWACHFA